MYACSSLENSRIKLTESGNSAVDIVILELGYVLQMDGGEGVGYDKVWCIKMLERKFSCWLAYIFNVGCHAEPLPPPPLRLPSSVVDPALHLSCIMFLEIQANQDEESFHVCFRCKSLDSR